MNKRRGWFLFCCLLFLAVGCSRRPETPKYDASAAAAQAMSLYDVNKDGFLDAAELVNCPGLRGCLAQFDTDKDGRLSEAEIRGALEKYAANDRPLVPMECKVKRGNEPLAGVMVRFEPEAFMAAAIKPALGVTDEQGVAQMQIEGASTPGCNFGVYRVRISKTDPKGHELLHPAYNAQSQLGAEIGLNSNNSVLFNLN